MTLPFSSLNSALELSPGERKAKRGGKKKKKKKIKKRKDRLVPNVDGVAADFKEVISTIAGKPCGRREKEEEKGEENEGGIKKGCSHIFVPGFLWIRFSHCVAPALAMDARRRKREKEGREKKGKRSKTEAPHTTSILVRGAPHPGKRKGGSGKKEKRK